MAAKGIETIVECRECPLYATIALSHLIFDGVLDR